MVEDCLRQESTPQRSVLLVNKDPDLERGLNVQRHTAAKSAKRSVVSLIPNRRPQRIVRCIIEDWLFLIALGFTVAVLSLAMETSIISLQALRKILMDSIPDQGEGIKGITLDFSAWVGYTLVLIVSAALFTRLVAPQANGSGIPEMKTILRGVMLKEYLSLRTLISKMVGLTLAIGSGLPIGKEGPFTHVGSICANLLSRLVRSFQPVYENESRSCEMLAAGCAVGVACTFSAPIGGVLFSIEVTAVYFAVRDYWRGFFAAACSSIFFSLMRLYTQSSEVTVVAFFQTSFKHRSFVPEELFFFGLLGLFCGLTGALFIFLHRNLALFLRRNRIMKAIFQKHFLVYPIFVSVLHAVVRYPKLLGQFVDGETVFNHKVWDFFKNCTWTADPTSTNACPGELIARWTNSGGHSIYLELTLFIFTFYIMCILCVLLPVPAGIFMPVYVVGAAMGRLFGEGMCAIFPYGIRGEAARILIYPGIYSVVGAASFCGGVTHTVSVAIITFEMTGQLLHIVPVMVAVIIANIVSAALQPSFFDSIIMIKRLPYLPDIPKSVSAVHAIRVDQIMVRKVISISKTDTYRRVKEVLERNAELRAFPIVNDRESMSLVGSVSRKTMKRAIDDQIGEQARTRAARDTVRRDQIRRLRTNSTVPGSENGIASDRHSSECVCTNDTRSSAYQGHRNYGLSMEDEESSGRDRAHTAPDLTPTTSPTSKSSHRNTQKIVTVGSHKKVHYAVSDMVHHLAQSLHHISSKNQVHPMVFTSVEEQKWLDKQLNKKIDMSLVEIDDAPFQLVEEVSLYKVHSLFSLIGLQRAYVTAHGALVGVVSLKEIRKGVEIVQSGDVGLLPCHLEHNVPVPSIIEHIAEDSDTDDEDVISPRAVLEDSPETSVRVRRNLLAVHGTSLTVCSSDDCDGAQCGHASSRAVSFAVGGEPLADSLNTYLDDTRQTTDIRRRSQNEPEMDTASLSASLKMHSTVPGVISSDIVWSPRCSGRDNDRL